jgi:hypothetical protein
MAALREKFGFRWTTAISNNASLPWRSEWFKTGRTGDDKLKLSALKKGAGGSIPIKRNRFVIVSNNIYPKPTFLLGSAH